MVRRRAEALKSEGGLASANFALIPHSLLWGASLDKRPAGTETHSALSLFPFSLEPSALSLFPLSFERSALSFRTPYAFRLDQCVNCQDQRFDPSHPPYLGNCPCSSDPSLLPIQHGEQLPPFMLCCGESAKNLLTNTRGIWNIIKQNS